MSSVVDNTTWQWRVKNLDGQIKEILRVTGTSGLSLSVLTAGQPAYEAHFGYRDYEARLVPDNQTLYYLASRTKFMVAAGIGLLVDEGKMTWETRVADILSDFVHHDETIMRYLTISDLLSHRSGLDASASYWQAEHGRITIKYEDFVKTASTLPVIKPFRTSLEYNNWGTGLAGIVLESIAGCSLGHFLKSRFFDVLNMQRTTLEVQPQRDNVARPYIWFDNDSPPFPLEYPSIGDGQSMAGSFAAKSCTSDLSTFYTAFMTALEDQRRRGTTSTPGNPFRQAERLTQPHVSISNNSIDGEYTLGWVSAQLPAPMSHTITPNSRFFKSHPLVGKNAPHTTHVLYAYGSTLGFLGSTTLIPSSQTAILVESNTLTNSDAPNWIGSMVLEAFIDVPEADRNDYVSIANEVSPVTPAQFRQMLDSIEAERQDVPQTRQPENFVGIYYNEAGSFYLDVFQDGAGDELWLSLNGYRSSEKYQLRALQVDVFEWAIDYEESCRRGMWPKATSDYFILYFEGNREAPDLIRWKRSGDVPGGDVFTRRSHASIESWAHSTTPDL